MNKNIILSIIIPVYNMELYLEKCLSSCLIKKNSSKLELVIINDGSNDSSHGIIENFINNNPDLNIKYINKENEGYGPTIEKGIKVSSGNYVKILDSDDWYINNELDNHIDFLIKQDADVVLSNFLYIFSDREQEWNQWKYFNDKNLINKIERGEKISINDQSIIDDISLWTMHCITVKRKIILRSLENYNFHKKVSYTDVIYVILCLLNSKEFVLDNRIIYNYFLAREGQTMQDINDKSFRNIFNSYLALFEGILYLKNNNNTSSNYYLFDKFMTSQISIFLNRIFKYIFWKKNYDNYEYIKRTYKFFYNKTQSYINKIDDDRIIVYNEYYKRYYLKKFFLNKYFLLTYIILRKRKFLYLIKIILKKFIEFS